MLYEISQSTPDVLQEIAGQLSVRELCRLSQVNRFFNSASISNRIWSRFFVSGQDQSGSAFTNAKAAFRQYYERQILEIQNCVDNYSYLRWDHLSPRSRTILQELLLYSISKNKIDTLVSLNEFTQSFKMFLQKHPALLAIFLDMLNGISSVSSSYEELMKFLNNESGAAMEDELLWTEYLPDFVS